MSLLNILKDSAKKYLKKNLNSSVVEDVLEGAVKKMIPVSVDENIKELLNNVVVALRNPDLEASAKALVPYLHESLVSNGDIVSSLKGFGFKKDHSNVNFYKYPVEVVKKEAETPYEFEGKMGNVVRYFIARVDDKTGMPAPIQIFEPQDGSGARVKYLGNL